MSATTRTRDKDALPAAYLILAAVVAFGLVLGIIRLVLGLGPTTNLSSGYPWGMWITFDVFAVPFAGGAFALAAVMHIFDRKEYHGIAHLALLVGFLGYTLVVLILLMDLGRWDHFYSVLMPYRWNPHSFLLEVSLCITLYLGVLALELVPVIFGRLGWKPAQEINRLIPLIAGVGIVCSTLHQSSLGSLFLLMPHKLHALWWTPILPLLFFTSAVFSGLSTAIFVAVVTWRALRKPVPVQILAGLAKLVAIIQAIYLVLKIGDLLVAGEMGLVFGSGPSSILFVAEMIIGVIAPLILFASRAGKSERGLLMGAVYVLVGLAFNRSAIAWFALEAPAGATYSPHWMECSIAIAAVATGILFFALGVRYLPALRESVLEEGH
jgi:Ni/Fe-hydrogenase subunit HybB-like protein